MMTTDQIVEEALTAIEMGQVSHESIIKRAVLLGVEEGRRLKEAELGNTFLKQIINRG